ncbi:MAG TPA: peptidoglycan editing factor PgeF [Patescibacteria group bacterium]|nr:peptidoglycan editing factor PgeF [Patescibacteria group bacterium]
MKFLTTDLEKMKWLSHGFFTRIGGASGGLYDSLNCAFSSKDDGENVRANRAKVAEVIGVEPENVVTLKQVHSNKVITVTQAWTRDKAPEADALVTAEKGLAISVLTADCAPVLFAAKRSRIVGAAHAGWKGALTGVMDETVKAMVALGAKAEDISAAIGPCIGPQSYEVSEGFEKPFLEQEAANEKFFRTGKPGHLIFDLPGYVAHRLQQAGVGAVYDTRQDTLTNESAYFSYRRSCLRGEPDYGRQISAIAIR